MKRELGSMKRENEILKEKCVSHTVQYEDLKGKVKSNSEKLMRHAN